MHALMNRSWTSRTALVAAGLFFQDPPQSAPTEALKPTTVDGKETEALRGAVGGFVITAEPLGGLVQRDLASGSTTTIREAKAGQPIVHELSGPDRDGRLLVVLSESPAATLALLPMKEGPAHPIAQGRDGAGFKFTFAGPALSPSGSHALVVRDPRSLYMAVEPKTIFHEGRVEVWDVASSKALAFTMSGLAGSVSWFPDGASFCISALISPAELPKDAIKTYNTKALGKEGSVIALADGRVPALFRVDVASGTKELLQVGRRCIVSSDGRSILVQGVGTEWMKRDVASGEIAGIRWPGAFHGADHPSRRLATYPGGPIAFLDSDLVVYWGLPTTGAAIGVTQGNSPLVGDKPMLTIKAARLSTGEFITLVPSIDPRRNITFGTTAAK